tara:strand:+ start:412 stop:600 length:189 start_codon:yes stop_codon:yes gene_type:complete
MSKQTEDILMEVHLEVTRLGLQRQFSKELKRMSKLTEWKWKDMATKYEGALRNIKEKYEKSK